MNNKAGMTIFLNWRSRCWSYQRKKENRRALAKEPTRTAQATTNETNRLELDSLESVLPESAEKRKTREVSCCVPYPTGATTARRCRANLQVGGDSILAVVEESDHTVRVHALARVKFVIGE